MRSQSIDGIIFDEEGRLYTYKAMTTTRSIEETLDDFKNVIEGNKTFEELEEFYKGKVAKENRPHVLYQASGDGEYHNGRHRPNFGVE